MIKPNEISDILKSKLEEVDKQAGFEEIGTVLEVGDGVAHVYGLDNVKASELVEFENGVRGVAMNLEESNVGVILLNDIEKVTENMTVRRYRAIGKFPFVGLFGVVGEGVAFKIYILIRVVFYFDPVLGVAVHIDNGIGVKRHKLAYVNLFVEKRARNYRSGSPAGNAKQH